VLVDVDWARAHLDDPKVRFIEVDVDTSAYDNGHLPGDRLQLASQLNDPTRRDLASREQLQALLRDAGVDDYTLIVFYGDNNNWFAAWAYWQLRYQGLDNVRLHNGGRKKVEAAGLPLTTDSPAHAKGNITLPESTREELRAYRNEVLAAIGDPSQGLVDVRSAEEYRGELSAPAHLPQEAAQRKGHIPARSTSRGRPPSPRTARSPIDELRAIYGAREYARSGRDAHRRIGERSSHTRSVPTEILGYRNVRNYDGSWTEYGLPVGALIEVGDPSQGSSQ
jgi:thiosulfate/3-mercaptopyruvate sulfurtransferase